MKVARYKDTTEKWLFTPIGELLLEEDGETQWLVEGLLPTGGLSLLVGKPKSGKSTLIRNLAISISQHTEFLDRSTNQGLVLYLALEEKRSEVKKHFIDLDVDERDQIHVAYRCPAMNAIDSLREYVEATNPALVIIDPLFKLVRVDDGNDYVKVLTALDPLLELARDTNTHICCIHHTNKGERTGGDSILGSTAILGTIDTALILKRTKAGQFIESTQRYGKDMEETRLLFDEDTRKISLGETKQQIKQDDVASQIIEFIAGQQHEPTEEEITSNVQGKTSDIRNQLRILIGKGVLSRTGDGKKGSPYMYTVR